MQEKEYSNAKMLWDIINKDIYIQNIVENFKGKVKKISR